MDLLQILIVEDDLSLRYLLRRDLEKRYEANIVEASGAHQAITLIKQGCFRLIVTDFNMPEGDGSILIDYLDAHPEINSSLIMYTGDDQILASPEWYERVITIRKPNYDELLQAIEQLGIEYES